MKISDAISNIKNYHHGYDSTGKKINDEQARDQILYGNAEQKCTGIITTIFASIDVIRQAHELGANLIIVHEALFWNHGDHQGWLEETKNHTYRMKKNLLNDYGIVVWRNHDYVHSGIPLEDGSYTDGIFYGFAKEMGWENYASKKANALTKFEIPEIRAKNLVKKMIQCLNLKGGRIIGNPEAKIRRIEIPFHIFGNANDEIIKMDTDKVDALLAMELVDFSINEYVRDSSMLGKNKVIITLGHFNMEEPGMKYMATYIPTALNEDIPCYFVQSGDTFHYVY
ncbi:Putative GTP cyclohydrolase 1 type 2, NIF3 family [Marinilactibacillus piezotolerans]|uniref:GTP cyclohydrolase 1 type 2 homolog n=1 Tax=Marinilactibacillus piezotolerans TaxID=258723 RepID=A0A1I3XMS8_9LACT|nr:Nif3-like dinuclear metal center hexameric protein [Marinilactibacillus piezotolerans]SFK20840.1 Putative GTP cyclohydrolase 1 type 2, NIF3 family [Marinilactibacillus piezotolerans]